MRKLNRREFLKNAAFGAAGLTAMGLSGAVSATEAPAAEAAAAGAAWREKPEPITEFAGEYDAEVIVVGHGYAGITACREIAESGRDVILLERQYEDMYMPNGNAGGVINAQILQERGVPSVDPIDYYNNWQLNTGYTANADLVMKYAQNAGANTDWYLDRLTQEDRGSMFIAFLNGGTGTAEPQALDQGRREHIMFELGGFKFWPSSCDFYGSCSQKMIHEYNREAAREAGARFMFNMEAKQLIQDESGAVIGLVAQDLDAAEDVYYRFNAKAVILATGGFGGDQEMLDDLLSDVNEMCVDGEAVSTGMSGRYGDGIKMAYWAGAKLENKPIATMGMRGSTQGWPQGVWLNPQGKRYCNEFWPAGEARGNQAPYMERGTYYSFYDSHLAEYMEYVTPGHSSQDPNEAFMSTLEDCMAQAVDAEGLCKVDYPEGFMISVSLYGAETLDALFAKMGITDEAVIANMKDSIARYNAMCEAGRDDDYARDPSVLFPVKDGPFYARTGSIRLGSALVTMGGLITDGEQQVLNGEYKPIPGLYASGNCCGRRFGRDYFTPITGVSLGMAWTLGRECGRSVVKALEANG